MEEPDVREETAGPISGRLEGVSVPDLMWSLCRGEATGVLRLTHDEVRKTVYFEGGRIVFAASSDPDDRLGEQLLRAGVVTLDQVEDAAALIGTGKRLGTSLVESGAITAGQLVQGVLDQVQQIVLGLFEWDRGDYVFEEGPLPTHEVITLGMKTGELLMRGVRRVKSFIRLRRSVGSPGCTYRLSTEAEDVLDGITLTEVEEEVRKQLLDGPRTVDSLCRGLYVSNFEICLALWGFRILGAVEVEERGRASAGNSSIEGRFGEEGIAPVLVPLSRIGETGVLYVTDGSVERSLHLREGRCVFATSSNVDDGLITFLLRRGVISLRDREETAKRLLSNKRVGTILREMGVLDDDDLRSMVSEHLREIVYETLVWNRGEFAFVPGELPTIEEITLDSSVENLVIEAIRRVAGFHRIRQGMGGVNRRLRLTPDFLDVLDRMKIGPEDWEVVTVLKNSRTALEACRETSLGDFRVCQILWAFRVLGVVEPDPTAAETSEDTAEATAAVPSLAPVAFSEEDRETAATEPAPPEDPTEREHRLAEVDTATSRVVWEEDPPPPVPEESPEPAGPDWNGSSEPERIPWQEPREALETPPLDSPGDATLYIPREEVEAALQAPHPEDEAPPLDDSPHAAIDEPADVEPQLSATMDRDGGEPAEPTEIPDEREPLEALHDSLDGSQDDTEELERAEIEGYLATGYSQPGVEVPCVAAPEDPLEPTSAEPVGEETIETILESEPDGETPDTLDTADPEPFVDHEEDSGDDGPREDDLEQRDPDDPPVDVALESIDATTEEKTGRTEPTPDDTRWEPPSDLDTQIARLNARQRVLFRTIRAEVGAGAVNFVRSCCGRLERDGESLFPESSLMRDGSWDESKLREAAIECRLTDPWSEYRELLDLELEFLRLHLGEARASALEQQLSRLDSDGEELGA